MMIREIKEYEFTVHLVGRSGLSCTMAIRPSGFYMAEMEWVHQANEVLSVAAMSKTQLLLNTSNGDVNSK